MGVAFSGERETYLLVCGAFGMAPFTKLLQAHLLSSPIALFLNVKLGLVRDSVATRLACISVEDVGHLVISNVCDRL